MWLISFVTALSAALLCNLHRLRERPSFLAVGVIVLLAPWVIGMALKGMPGHNPPVIH